MENLSLNSVVVLVVVVVTVVALALLFKISWKYRPIDNIPITRFEISKVIYISLIILIAFLINDMSGVVDPIIIILIFSIVATSMGIKDD